MGDGFDHEHDGIGAAALADAGLSIDSDFGGKLVGALTRQHDMFERQQTLAEVKAEIERLERENKSLSRRLNKAYSDNRAANLRIASLQSTFRLRPTEEKRRIDHLEQAIEQVLEQFRGTVRARGCLDTEWGILTVALLLDGLAPATDWFSLKSKAKIKRGDF